jgi:hypothetical protein
MKEGPEVWEEEEGFEAERRFVGEGTAGNASEEVVGSTVVAAGRDREGLGFVGVLKTGGGGGFSDFDDEAAGLTSFAFSFNDFALVEADETFALL